MVKAMYVHVPFCDSICAYCDFGRCKMQPQLADRWLTAIAVSYTHLAACGTILGFDADSMKVAVDGGIIHIHQPVSYTHLFLIQRSIRHCHAFDYTSISICRL